MNIDILQSLKNINTVHDVATQVVDGPDGMGYNPQTEIYSSDSLVSAPSGDTLGSGDVDILEILSTGDRLLTKIRLVNGVTKIYPQIKL